jgi:hypothetical protein
MYVTVELSPKSNASTAAEVDVIFKQMQTASVYGSPTY